VDLIKITFILSVNGIGPEELNVIGKMSILLQLTYRSKTFNGHGVLVALQQFLHIETSGNLLHNNLRIFGYGISRYGHSTIKN